MPLFEFPIYPYIFISCDKVGIEGLLITINDSSIFHLYPYSPIIACVIFTHTHYNCSKSAYILCKDSFIFSCIKKLLMLLSKYMQ